MSDMFFGASPQTFEKAKILRNHMTGAEKTLWCQLSNKKLAGYKFRRQHPIGNYIADFYCHEAKLVIEVDGDVHSAIEQAEYDFGRTHHFQTVGIKVIRFTNDEVEHQTEKVLSNILFNLL